MKTIAQKKIERHLKKKRIEIIPNILDTFDKEQIHEIPKVSFAQKIMRLII